MCLKPSLTSRALNIAGLLQFESPGSTWIISMHCGLVFFVSEKCVVQNSTENEILTS